MTRWKSVTRPTNLQQMGARDMWKAVISVGLPAVAQPIHEAGHVIAVRLSTGVSPRFTLWAVFPPVIPSQEAALARTFHHDLLNGRSVSTGNPQIWKSTSRRGNSRAYANPAGFASERYLSSTSKAP